MSNEHWATQPRYVWTYFVEHILYVQQNPRTDALIRKPKFTHTIFNFNRYTQKCATNSYKVQTRLPFKTRIKAYDLTFPQSRPYSREHFRTIFPLITLMHEKTRSDPTLAHKSRHNQSTIEFLSRHLSATRCVTAWCPGGDLCSTLQSRSSRRSPCVRRWSRCLLWRQRSTVRPEESATGPALRSLQPPSGGIWRTLPQAPHTTVRPCICV